MTRRQPEAGYALLAALVVTALAAVFAATGVAAVLARQHVSAADRRGARAAALERRALAVACLQARRGSWASGGSIAGGPGGDERWRVTWSPISGQAASAWPRFDVGVEAVSGVARRSLEAVVELRREAFACGQVVAGDAEFAAPAIVSGSGLYCGGSVRGREWVSFSSADGVPDTDGVHGDVWPSQGVHALGGIWARGVESHDGSVAFPEDTDTHTAGNVVWRAVSSPTPDWMETIGDWADDPGGALDAGVLRLDRVPAARSEGAGRPPCAGFVFWLPAGDPPVRVAGVRPPGWCPVLVVSGADLILGDPSTDTSYAGAAVALGRVDVDGSTSLEGSLYAGSLMVAASFTLTVPPTWRVRPLVGLVDPVIDAIGTATSAGN